MVASHLHFDHAGGTHLFPEAKHYHGQGELAFAHFPTPIAAFCYMPDQLERTRGTSTGARCPAATSTSSATAAWCCCRCPATPRASSASRCGSRRSTFLLTGDAVHLRGALEREYHFPIDWDTRVALDSLKRIKRIAEAEEASVWITHDPDDWNEFKHAPYCYE